MNLLSFEIRILLLSLKISLIASLWILPIAVAYVYFCRRPFFLRSILDLIFHLPLVLPPVVVGYFLLVVLGRRGIIGSFLYETFGFCFSFHWLGASLACGIVSFPLMIRACQSAFSTIDPLLQEAASSLGASPWKVFRSIIFPQVSHGVVSGFVLAWGRSLGEFGATVTFISNMEGLQTLPLAIYTQLQIPGKEASSFRLVIFCVLLSGVCLFLSDRIQKRN